MICICYTWLHQTVFLSSQRHWRILNRSQICNEWLWGNSRLLTGSEGGWLDRKMRSSQDKIEMKQARSIMDWYLVHKQEGELPTNSSRVNYSLSQVLQELIRWYSWTGLYSWMYSKSTYPFVVHVGTPAPLPSALLPPPPHLSPPPPHPPKIQKTPTPTAACYGHVHSSFKQIVWAFSNTQF